MNKYDVIYEALEYQVENGELTVEEANEVLGVAYEKHLGGITKNNKTYSQQIINSKRTVKEAISKIKNAVKNNRFDDAYAAIDSARGAIDDIESVVKNAPNDALDTIIPMAINAGVGFISSFAADEITSRLNISVDGIRFNSKTGGFRPILKTKVDTRKPDKRDLQIAKRSALISTGNSLMSSGSGMAYTKLKTGSASTNAYKNKAFQALAKARKELDKLERKVKNAEIKYNNSK